MQRLKMEEEQEKTREMVLNKKVKRTNNELSEQ